MDPPPNEEESATEEASDNGGDEDDNDEDDSGNPPASGGEDGGEHAGGDNKDGGSGTKELAALKEEMEAMRRNLELEKLRHERSLLKAEQRLSREREVGYRRLLRHQKEQQEARVQELSAQASRSHHAMLTNMVMANNNPNLPSGALSEVLLHMMRTGGQQGNASAHALLQENDSIG